MPDLYDLARAAGWEPHNLHDLLHTIPELELHHADLAQHLLTAG